MDNLKKVLSSMPINKIQTPSHMKDALRVYSNMVTAGELKVDLRNFLNLLSHFLKNFLGDDQLTSMVADFGTYCSGQPIRPDSRLEMTDEQLIQDKVSLEAKKAEQPKVPKKRGPKPKLQPNQHTAGLHTRNPKDYE